MRRKHCFVWGITLLMLLIAGRSNAQAATPPVTWKRLVDGDVVGVSISPDGKHIFYGNSDTGQLTVFDWQTNKRIWQIDAGTYSGVKSRWSPDGKYIATWTDLRYFEGTDKGIQIYDATNGNHLTLPENAFSIAENILRNMPCCDRQTFVSYTDLAWNATASQVAALAYGRIVVYDFATNTIPTVVDLSISNEFMSYFDWSPDQAKFAAFHLRQDMVNNRIAIPFEEIMGFWDQDGYWLQKYEQTDNDSISGNNCVPNGKGIYQSPEYPIGGPVAWAPDNQTIAVSTLGANQITVCSLQSNNMLLVHSVISGVALDLHWSLDQKWLFSILSDCTLVISDVDKNYANYTQPFEAERCEFYSGGWSSDSRYLAIGSSLGLWIGTITSA